MTTYKDSGVNINATDKMIKDIADFSKQTVRPGQMNGIGGFAGIFDLKKCGYSDPLLVTSADGIGTKILLGIETQIIAGLGYDLVGMCLNDTVCHGADPLFFLDYYASSKIDKKSFLQVIKSIAIACKANDCLLIGGETAEMPGVYQLKDFDLAGFCVGAVERDNALPKKNLMKEGDILIGVSSSGFHSNGYSLIRKILKDKSCDLKKPTPFKSNWNSLGEAIMEPTRLYYPLLKPLISKNLIKGMAHITGGGIVSNIPRMLPDYFGAEVIYKNLPITNIFKWFKDISNMKKKDMLSTFNCGVGMVLVIDANSKEEILNQVRENKDFFEIGHLAKSSKGNYCNIN